MICAGVLEYLQEEETVTVMAAKHRINLAHFLASLHRVGSFIFCAFARGEYAMMAIFSLWQKDTQSSHARKGCVSI